MKFIYSFFLISLGTSTVNTKRILLLTSQSIGVSRRKSHTGQCLTNLSHLVATGGIEPPPKESKSFVLTIILSGNMSWRTFATTNSLAETLSTTNIILSYHIDKYYYVKNYFFFDFIYFLPPVVPLL